MSSNDAFNSRAAPKSGWWPDTALQALAAWWAKRLPAEHDGAAITPEQLALFEASLVKRMKKTDPGFSEFPRVTMSTHDMMMFGALRDAGIGGDRPTEVTKALPRLWTFAFPDGQVFVPDQIADKSKQVPLDYPGRPETRLMPLMDIDFSDCSYYRDESRYLVVPLKAGQAYTLRQGFDEGKPSYHEGVATEGQVLVVWEDRRGMLDKMTTADALDPRRMPDISFSHVSPAAEYAQGAVCPRSGTVVSRVETEGDKNIVYTLSTPFRAWQAADTFGTGAGSIYQVVHPGDFVTRKESDGALEVRPKDARSGGWQTWLLCDKDGDLDFRMALDTAAKVSKPLKLTPKK
ncbi:MAG: hypothetical protein ACAH80_09540 [Alphaproteobacteria bacterium]